MDTKADRAHGFTSFLITVMDNFLGIFDGDFAGEGNIDYLQFRLERIQRSRQPDKEPIHNLEGFFSLKLALCTMLMTKPDLVDPDLVDSQKKTYYHSMRILRAENNATLATHICVKLYDKQYHGLPPGIYLQTSYTMDELRRLTGIPFPPSGALPDDHMICLAHYHSDFKAAIPTSFYERLATYASDILEITRRDMEEFTHQLTYKGTYRGNDHQPMSGKGSKYVEQHYYNNPHEPIKKLLLTDPFKFDHLCKWNSYLALHDHGYVTNPNEDVIATIEVVGFNPSPTSQLTPGIYFHCLDELVKFQQQAQLDLRFMSDYVDSQTTLALAHYQFQQRYSLHVASPLVSFKSNYLTGQLDMGAVPHSPFTTTTTYQFDPFAPTAQPFRIASDYYHYETLEMALAKLLGTDFTLFQSTMAQSVGYHILQAIVFGKDATPLASLELMRQPPPPGMTEPLPWHIYLQLHQNIELPNDIRSALATLEGSHVLTQNEERHLCIPVARLTADQVMEPIHQNLRTICAMLGRPMPDKTLDGDQRHAQRAVSSTSAESDYFTLCFDKAKQLPGEGPSIEQELVTIKGLSNAYALLLLLDPESFQPGNSRYGNAHLARVRLYEGTIPAVAEGNTSVVWTQPSPENLLVTRFYQTYTASDRPPGYCLHFNESHPKAIHLAMSELPPLLTAACEQHHLVFSLNAAQAPDTHKPHPRKIPDPDGNSQAPGPKL
ncbi:hypothetical protein HB364_13840 [Pseudoflavitalea sp. X16]|uniref:hypothetical protein n=1 Tax=Paraflavitalea devenefica TaxID=2716334 RepID=UPI00141E9969|nr:hypothetical protein [Paraflavitalea devenefica]NII26170.1 hypothetical protein [Paraflavitalea devenefica]